MLLLLLSSSSLGTRGTRYSLRNSSSDRRTGGPADAEDAGPVLEEEAAVVAVVAGADDAGPVLEEEAAVVAVVAGAVELEAAEADAFFFALLLLLLLAHMALAFFVSSLSFFATLTLHLAHSLNVIGHIAKKC
jgi:hypothetical protein